MGYKDFEDKMFNVERTPRMDEETRLLFDMCVSLQSISSKLDYLEDLKKVIGNMASMIDTLDAVSKRQLDLTHNQVFLKNEQKTLNKTQKELKESQEEIKEIKEEVTKKLETVESRQEEVADVKMNTCKECGKSFVNIGEYLAHCKIHKSK